MTQENKMSEIEKTEKLKPGTDELSEQEKAEEFYIKYENLCREYGYTLVTVPAFVHRDDGTFSIVLKTNVGRISNN